MAHLAELATRLEGIQAAPRLRWTAYLRRAGVEVPEVRVTSIKPRQTWHLGAEILRVIDVAWDRGADDRFTEIARCRDADGAVRLVPCRELLERGSRPGRQRAQKKTQAA